MAFAILAVLIGALSGVPSAWADAKRVALVVGAGRYVAVPELANPPRDASAIADALRLAGFETTLLIDPDKARLEAAVRRLGSAARSADAALLFYAGHALEYNGKNFMIPVNAEIQSARDLPFETLDVDIVIDQLSGAKVSLLFMDACRDNPFALRLGAGDRGFSSRGLARVDAVAAGILVAFATAPGHTAADGRGDHSPFTRAILDNINTPGLEIRQLLGRVRRQVREESRGEQIPWETSALEGEFYFYPPGSAAPPVSSTAAPAPPAPTGPAIAFAPPPATPAAPPTRSAEATLKVAMDFSFTGADAESAVRLSNGAILAFEEANASREVPGYRFEPVKFDDATARAGQYDPAQAAANARLMVADSGFVAALGPQMSGAGKAMAPILSAGNLPTITPSSTNPDITDPRFASQYRPAGRAIYFRTIATDADQAPQMANYMAENLRVRSVYILDDMRAYGTGLADSFQAQAKQKGLKLLGRNHLEPDSADYSAILADIKAKNPDAIYYGGLDLTGAKFAKQLYAVMPRVVKAAGDGLLSDGFVRGAGFPAAEGWYVSVAGPHFDWVEDRYFRDFVVRYRKRFNQVPTDYTVTTYAAARVIIEAVKAVVRSGRTPDRTNVRDAIQSINYQDLVLGSIQFDPNGDVVNRIVSIYQVRRDSGAAPEEWNRQYKYLERAPTR